MASKIYSALAQQDEFIVSTKPLFSKIDNNEVYPQDKILSQKSEILAKKNEKIDSITDLPLPKLDNKDALTDTLSDSMNPIFSKHHPIILTTDSSRYFTTMESSLKPTEMTQVNPFKSPINQPHVYLIQIFCLLQVFYQEMTHHILSVIR